MRLTMLGTGFAQATEVYNTCFVIEDEGKHLLVDGGGGSRVLSRLKEAGYRWQDMRDIIVTHKHIDHLLGIIWMLRMMLQGMSRGQYDGEVRLYAHGEVIGLLRQLSGLLLEPKETAFLDEKFHLIEVQDGETVEIIGHPVTFFDIGSTKAKQYGFSLQMNGEEHLCCCGDEPFNEREERYARGAKWLLHEAFCLYSQRDIYNPYKKSHSTVKDACELAERLGADNLILYHTEDDNILRRKELYLEEGRQYYSRNLLIPEDLETIEL